jgi:hypothetical protein
MSAAEAAIVIITLFLSSGFKDISFPGGAVLRNRPPGGDGPMVHDSGLFGNMLLHTGNGAKQADSRRLRMERLVFPSRRIDPCLY